MKKTKCCTGCRRDLALDEFPLDASKPDGHHTRCRQCKKKSASTSRGGESAVRQRERGMAEARQAALERLVARHESDFLRLFYSEAVRRGLVEPGHFEEAAKGLVA